MAVSRRPAVEGYVHEAGLYGSDDELIALACPFLAGGSDAGEPTVVSLPSSAEAVVRNAVGELPHVTYLPGPDVYGRPAAAIRRYRAIFDDLVEHGADLMRVMGSIPTSGFGPRWEEWLRYELATDIAFAPYSLWSLCLYDTRLAPPEVIDDAVASHATCLVDGHRRSNPNPPRAVLEGRAAPGPDPLQLTPPEVAMMDPRPAEARAAASSVAGSAALDPRRTEDLLVVVSELVSNGLQHGRAPVIVELWAEPGRVLCSVSDAGSGPQDPLAGLMRQDDSAGGMGLWMAHQLADQVLSTANPSGFTIRAAVGR